MSDPRVQQLGEQLGEQLEEGGGGRAGGGGGGQHNAAAQAEEEAHIRGVRTLHPNSLENLRPGECPGCGEPLHNR